MSTKDTRRALDGLDGEMRDHIERQIQDNLERGMTPEEARRQAMLTFGNVALAAEATRAVSRWQWLEQLVQDSRYAMRMLRRRPTYALLSMLTLALGVAGTASVYGIVRGVLFDPLPFAHEREVAVFWKKTDWNHEEYLHIRGRVPGFSQVALYRMRDVIVREGDGPARLVRGVSGSAELFDVLGAAPMFGRGLRAGDDVASSEPIAILSFGLWQDMGANPSIIGSRLTLDGTRRTVVGVMPRGFWFPDPSVRVWMPEILTPTSRSWNSTLVGRVAPSHDVHKMDTPVAQLAAALGERFEYPAQLDKRQNPYVTPVRDDLVGRLRPALLATLGAMALILLIGCANVAALVLGQVDARSAEFAVRSALGAKRGRLAQQVVVEVLFVAGGAALLGALLARAAFPALIQALPLGAWAESAAPDWRVFASAMVIAMGAALLVMLIPIVSLWRGDLRGALNRIRGGGIEGRGGRLENGLVIIQVALAVMIAASAALLGRSVANMYAVEPGVRTDGIAVVDVVLRDSANRVQQEQTLIDIIAALRELPGVQSVAAAQTLPLRGGNYRAPLALPDRPDIPPIAAEYRIATPEYLETLGIPMRRGRSIERTDRGDTERIVVINEALAQKYFAGVDPIGRLLSGDGSTPARIVGVAADAAEKGLTDFPGPVRYVALAQTRWIDDAQSFVLRARPGVDETSLLEAARRTVMRVVPGAVVQETTTMRRVLDIAIGPARKVVLLLSLMTALSLVLGAVGVYGVIAHYAARRRRDWAIRVALGLPGTRVISHVVGHAVLLVTAGIVIGAAAAAMLTRMLSSFLYGVSALDPIAFAAAGTALLAVGTIAAFLPAWRAGTANPLIALREQ